MRRLGLHGAVRGKVNGTTVADRAAKLLEDLVQRRFAPPAPDRLWVADITYVSTWSGWVYVAPEVEDPTGRERDLPQRRRRRAAGSAV